MSPALLALVLAGCGGSKDAPDFSAGTGDDSAGVTDTDTPADVSTVIWRGDSAGQGFGSALAGDGTQLYAGAPGSHQVYALAPDGATSLALEGDGMLGSALALDADGALWASAPLSGVGGALVSTSTTLSGEAGAVLGGRLIRAGDGLAATTSQGAWLGGDVVSLGARAGGLAWWNDALVVGLPWGGEALWRDGELAGRVGARDEAGYALCAADFDGDGVADLAVGAPAAGQVYLLTGGDAALDLATATVLTAAGRFGHALACAAGALHVGAPGWGDEAEGAVWTFAGDPSGWTAQAPDHIGASAQANLGWSLLAVGGALYAGAPGGATEPGYVAQLSQ